MKAPRDFSRDTFSACLLMLRVKFEQAGLTRDEIARSLRAQLRAVGGVPAAQPFDPSRPADGGEVYVDVKGGGDA